MTYVTTTSRSSSPKAPTPPSSPPRLGHTSVKTVLDVYGRLYEGLDRNAADTLEPPWNPSHVDAMWTQTNKRRDTGRGLT